MTPTLLFAITIVILMVLTPFFVFQYWSRSRSLAKRADYLESLTYTTLQVDVPRNNEKTPLSAEQFFASLHGILRDDPAIQEHVSFEIVAMTTAIQFYIFLPIHLQEFVEGQIYAQYPDVHIQRVDDYTRTANIDQSTIAQTDLKLNKDQVYPLRTFVSFEVDPLAGITAVLSKLATNEQAWIQIVTRPVNDIWQKKGLDLIKKVKSGVKDERSNPFSFIGRLFLAVIKEFASPGSSAGAEKEETKVDLPGTVTEAMSGIENKITKLGFETKIRVLAISDNETAAKTRVQSLVGAFKQFNTTNMNGFSAGEIKVNDPELWSNYINRTFEDNTGYIFNTEELASVYHFPNQSVETPNLRWAGAKRGDAPPNLPMKGAVEDEKLTLIGRTDFRNTEREFGIKMIDRMQHCYVIGKSGGGKSKLLLNMIKDDIMEGRGVIVVDPHGELADETMSIVPPSRIKDTIIFDPSDREFPIAFNLLEEVGEDFKGMVASGFVGIFKKIFGYSWGPRLEHILRNTVLALLDHPDSTMLSIPRMLTERSFRDEVIDHIKDPVIADFWVNEFGSMDNKFQTEAVSPILNKVGQFLSTPTIRNIVGQKRSAINIRQVMDQQKILIVNLSRGKIGEDNAALMGAMMITKVQLAAMSRADVVASERPACFLYVDEFQNFATESFAVILSEARKYGLGLTLAHQYIAQMSEEVRDAVFGNVGTIISFRVGATDAEYLVKEYTPVFDEVDLVNLEKYHIYIKLLIDGLAVPAFSAITLAPPETSSEYLKEMIQHTHDSYASARNDVESSIEQWSGIKEKMQARQAAKEAGGILRTESANRAYKPAPKVEPPKPDTSGGGVLPKQIVEVPEEKSVANEVIEEQSQPVEQGSGTENVANVAEVELYEPKQLRAIGNRVYKEHTQRGGVKWFVGEPKEIAIGREQDRVKRSEEKLNSPSAAS